MKYSTTLALLAISTISWGQGYPGKAYSPIEKIKLVADHIIASNPYQYELKPARKKDRLTDLNFVDFGRTLGKGRPAVAYAQTWINSEEAQSLTLDLEYSHGIKIFLNDDEVYRDYSDHIGKIVIEERSLELSKEVTLTLKKGSNKLLMKSETSGKPWVVYFKADQKPKGVTIGLKDAPFVSDKLAALSNWLVVGPFENPNNGNKRTGIDIVYPPEQAFEIGRLYSGIDEPVTWTMPKIEVLADAVPIDPIWGSYLNYNYHTGGVAWAMMHLSEVTGEKRFDDYARRYTDFMIETKPFVQYQMEQLNEYKSVNHHLINTPLLDFTLAPSLPFIYRLVKEDDFENRDAYVQWVDEITKYAIHEQLRMNNKHYARLTPKVMTTWVDDMFMGLPYLIHAAVLAEDKDLKKQLFDDAASQVLSFNEEVWDPGAKLYQHAQYSENKVKMPHWSRANGWGIWAITEVLKALPKNHPHYKEILDHYRTHVNSLIRFQDADGFWTNVIDVKSVQETSGTAIFTMAIARGINQGWLKRRKYEPYALKGWKALDSVIDEDGTVHQICMGTMCSEDIEYYLKRPIVDDDSHGMLGLIAAAIEVQEMMDAR